MKPIWSVKSSCTPSRCSVLFFYMKWGVPSIQSWEEVAFFVLDEKLKRGSRENCVPQHTCTIAYFSVIALCDILQTILQSSDKIQKYIEDNQFTFFPSGWKRLFLQTNLGKKKSVISKTHEKSFLSTHTFFLQSPTNNASMHFHVIYWQRSLSWQG